MQQSNVHHITSHHTTSHHTSNSFVISHSAFSASSHHTTPHTSNSSLLSAAPFLPLPETKKCGPRTAQPRGGGLATAAPRHHCRTIPQLTAASPPVSQTRTAASKSLCVCVCVRMCVCATDRFCSCMCVCACGVFAHVVFLRMCLRMWCVLGVCYVQTRILKM